MQQRDKKNALDYLTKSEMTIMITAEMIMISIISERTRFLKCLLMMLKIPKLNLESLWQSASKYNPAKRMICLHLLITSADDQFVALKKADNLDSVAGKGTDVATNNQLMEWVHY